MLEDVHTDVELAEIELRQAGIEFNSRVVMTEKEFLQELEVFKPDIILSDYALPQFNGLKALQLTRELYPPTPFILVTGSTNEEIAVECMKQGADDYVLKRSLKRLPGALEKAIERRKGQIEKEEAEARYRSLFENSLDGIYRITTEGNFIEVNPALIKMLGYQSKEELISARDDKNLQFLASNQRKKGAKIQIHSFQVRGKKDTKIWIEDNSWSILDEKGRTLYYEGVVRNITERKRAEEMIRYQAYHDSLTQLPNRLLFNDRLSLAITQAHRHRKMLAVLFLDLDRFKLVNDILGHTKGDRLLQGVTKRLIKLLTEGDTIARMGGDEFALLIPEISQVEDAAKIAQGVIHSLKSSFNLNGHEIYITTSVGVCVYPNDGQDAENLLKNAEAAMYRAKEKGRNNYQFYTPIMNDKILERLDLENSLRHALNRQEMVAYYQPQVDLNSGKITGMEALARWQHPKLGLVSPACFIPLAEETGLIVPLGEYILSAACAQNKAWQESGLPPLRVAVNLSARQFQQEDLVERVAQILEKTKLASRYLELELTESAVMQDVEFTANTLRDLRKMGVHIAIDDFGTGYSSLSYLKKFPINTLKIDQSFIRDLTTDSNDAAIATAVIALAHSLDLKVTAEGVETQKQLNFLKKQKCDKMQGYLFSRPIPAKDFEKLLIKENI